MDEKEMLIKKANYMKFAMWTFIVLIGISGYAVILMGEQIGKAYYLGFTLIIPLGILALYFRRKMLKYKALYSIKNSWGNKDIRKRKFEDIKKLYEYMKKESEDAFFIDDQTWDDLTMNKIFEEIDRTFSAAGEQILYFMLRNPKFNDKELTKRKLLLKFFKENKELREKILVELYYLGRQTKNRITDLLWGELPKKSWVSIFFNFMALLPIIILLLIPFMGIKIGIYIVVVFIINMYISYKFRNEISAHVEAMSYLSAVVNTGKKLCEISSGELSDYTEGLKSNLKHIKASKSASLLGSINADVILQYFNILFLIKERSFFKVIGELTKYKREMQNVYIAIGEIDALISIASYREGLTFYVEPELVSGERVLDISNLVHPLVTNPIANSISIFNQGIVLTGSNMSGKSTFLRTIGVNALLAQTIATCIAKNYKGSYFKILSSISPNDDILQGKSYYLGEAEAVLRIINNCEDNIPSLCIIDEIFRGTNPIERISASSEILDYLINHNSVPIVATHDLELTGIVDKSYECYYFTEDVGEDGLKFDYLIRKGVSQTTNAIKLLKFLGYPDNIIENTYKRIDKLFLK
ncbi:MutS-related protein [Candidatus Clostridium stratigraminis]|uniref:MutS-related protein n=1 Tax=Candidatus Clostridium stratigraminis TaxID=3381661 RepID=A0ABW8T2G2_9CLOT